jgi:hypothetical protein
MQMQARFWRRGKNCDIGHAESLNMPMLGVGMVPNRRVPAAVVQLKLRPDNAWHCLALTSSELRHRQTKPNANSLQPWNASEQNRGPVCNASNESGAGPSNPSLAH